MLTQITTCLKINGKKSTFTKYETEFVEIGLDFSSFETFLSKNHATFKNGMNDEISKTAIYSKKYYCFKIEFFK